MILITTGVERTASTWLEAVFLAIREELDLHWHSRGADAYREALAEGGLKDDHIYVGVFLRWDELRLEACRYPYRVLHVRRDPRDILVSMYYALRDSHVPNAAVERYRPILTRLSYEDGLLRTCDRMDRVIEILISYLDKSRADHCQVCEFSELTRDPFRHIGEYLRFAGLSLPDPLLHDLLDARDFRTLSGGRSPGEERIDHHFRRGISGEWREKLPPRVVEEFRKRFGDALIQLGYEKDGRWA